MKGETGKTLMFYVEPMQQSDVATVAAIERMVFTMPWSSSAFGYELRANPLSHYFVARVRSQGAQPGALEQDSGIVGYGGFWMMLDEGHICTLGVHPDWRRRGIGELLLSHMIAQAAGLGANVVTLEVRVSNLAAQQLYQKYGFSTVGLRKGYYSDNNEDALIMTTEPIGSAAYQSRYNRLQRMLHQRLALAQPQGERVH
ncbi:MAG: ribosomal protein S18-alanine N-acetyltransferase [Anaerolineae bacterium]